MMEVKVKRTLETAKLPTYGSEGAAGFDLYAAQIVHEKVEGQSKGTLTFNTGLSFEIPKDHVMLVFSRSSIGFNQGATLVNSVGVIDSDYRGEVMVKFNKNVVAEVGDRIAQGIIIPYPKINFTEVEELSSTERGEGGFGSTGK